jgi:ADP-ribosylglycohydrolase
MKLCLLGALWGDICGVPYEFCPERNTAKINLNHPLRMISDDSILT